jgi:hypothetical protein
MPIYEKVPSIWAAAPKRGVCIHCGDEFPLEIGDRADTCLAWIHLTIARLPKPIPFEVISGLCLFGKICKLYHLISRDMAPLLDGEMVGIFPGRGLPMGDPQ